MRTSFVPLYQRIQERIRAEFLVGAVGNDAARLPTERDLQVRYGVSRPTISKALAALAAEGHVTKTQGRGSFAVHRAASTEGGAQRRIGYVAPLSDAPLVQRAFGGIDHVVQRRGYSVLLSSAAWDVERERRAVEDLISTGVRGLVVYPVPRTQAELRSDYLTGGDLPVPIVLIDTPIPAQGHTQVVFDNRRVGYAMTMWLIGRGCRRIAMLGCGENVFHASLMDRQVGYRSALRDSGIAYDPELVCGVDMRNQTPDVAAALEHWFALHEPPTAIVGADDVTALEAIDLLSSAGVRVPEDVRVVGFDNRDEARRHHPVFPTTSPDFERMGELACDLLLDAIQGDAGPDRTYVLDVPLLTRRGADRAAPALVLRGGSPRPAAGFAAG